MPCGKSGEPAVGHRQAEHHSLPEAPLLNCKFALQFSKWLSESGAPILSANWTRRSNGFQPARALNAVDAMAMARQKSASMATATRLTSLPSACAMARPCMWETARCFRASALRHAAISQRCLGRAQMLPMPRISILTWGRTAKAATTAFANRGRGSLEKKKKKKKKNFFFFFFFVKHVATPLH